MATVVDILVGALVLILAALAGFGIAQPLSGPALNRIVRRAEADLGAAGSMGAWPPSSFAEDVGRALQSIALSYAIRLPILAVLYAITFFFPPAAVVTFPIKLVVLGLVVAWDLCDYPLSIHRVPVAARVAFVSRNLRAMVGFGFGLGLLSLLPCALVLVLPAGVAGRRAAHAGASSSSRRRTHPEAFHRGLPLPSPGANGHRSPAMHQPLPPRLPEQAHRRDARCGSCGRPAATWP